MKKNWPGLVLILVMILMSGCVGKVSRGVKENTFYSTHPRIAVRMAPDFEYVNKKKKSNAFNTTTDSYASISTKENFVFANLLSKSIAVIEINQIDSQRVYWISDITAYFKDFISTGYEEKEGERYQYVVFVNQDNNGECRIIKRYSRVSGGTRNTILNIYYAEILGQEDRNLFNCEKETRRLEELPPKGRLVHDRFMANSNRNISFVNLDELGIE